MPSRHVIVGTAGHIDHGKSSLVRALTGTDPDRLEEEKRRGITIDLGFADLQIDQTRFAFIDVPGHERFVRNMLAGVGGIDVVLLVVAANEGVMPQTREHFEICRLLGIRRGIVAITKSDLASPEALFVHKENVQALVRGSFLEGAPIVPVSARTGAGLEDLRRELLRLSQEGFEHDRQGLTRLPIDRVFTMKGFGTVVTGTLIAGTVRKEDELELHPSLRRVRVRGIQVHGKTRESAEAGERTAINLAGADKADLSRGMVLAAPGLLRSTALIDVELNLLEGVEVRLGARLHLHAYSAETVATVKQLMPGERRLARLKLDAPLQLVAGDRFIVRRYSPVATIGGGMVLGPLPPKKMLRERVLPVSPAERFAAWVAESGTAGMPVRELIAKSGRPEDDVVTWVAQAVGCGSVVQLGQSIYTKEAFEGLVARASQLLEAFHSGERLATGINRDQFRRQLKLNSDSFAQLVAILESRHIAERSEDVLRLRGAAPRMEDAESAAMKQILNAFASAGLRVPALDEVLAGLRIPSQQARKIVTMLLRDRTLIKLGDDLVFHKDALEALRGMLADYKQKRSKSTIDVAGFKDLTGVSRKYAIPLLEHLDRQRITRREGNVRVIL